MGETQFAKSFLTSLDPKSTKYKPDHVFDPQTFQTRVPYTLPKLSHPPHPPPPRSSEAPPPPPGSTPASSQPAVTIILKSSRNPNMTLTLPALPLSTTISQLKEAVHSHLGGPSVVQSVDKIKIIHNKKPIPASKGTLADLDGLSADAGDIELGVMVMGGAPDPPPQQPPAAAGPASQEEPNAAETVDTPMPDVPTTSSAPPMQPGEASGREVLSTTEFWDDLQGFLEQRLRDQAEAVRLRGVFEKVWS